MEGKNSFLNQLLDLEVSGKDAISAPSNWTDRPLLDIDTEVDSIINEVAPLLKSNDDREGVWWFLVGSPGNGKSAAVGKLVRTLKEEHGSIFRLPKEDSRLGKELNELDPDDIPYEVELYEGDNKYPSALFAQDASVVPDPYVNPDTGAALIDLLQNASEKGLSVVVCANRGVIEKALQHLGDIKDNGAVYKALRALGDKKSSGPDKIISFKSTHHQRRVFDKVKFKVTPLDEKSIIANGTFKKLIDKAVDEKNWATCNECSSASLCPFKNNRDWLAEETKSRFIDTLRYAELMSNQAMVFREALAFIALSLSGSSRDYKKLTPCEWVHERVEKKAYFSLLSRRIYMILFQSYTAFGLKEDEADKKEQLRILGEVVGFLATENQKPIKQLKADKIATDVGLKRFLATDGVLREIDPVKENQGKALEQKWNIAPNDEKSEIYDEPLVGELEEMCLKVWADCEEHAEDIDKQYSAQYYRELRRWITSVTYRLGFFAQGRLLFQEELKQYEQALKIRSSNLDDMSDLDMDLADQIGENFKVFIFSSTENAEIKISQNITISGKKVSQYLEPKLAPEKSGDTRLKMELGQEFLEISPRSFVWLQRKAKSNLSDKTFPPDVQQVAHDIRSRGATYIDYAFMDHAELQIKKPNGETLNLRRRGVRLREKDQP